MQVAMASEDGPGLDCPKPKPGGSKIDHDMLKSILSREAVPEICLTRDSPVHNQAPPAAAPAAAAAATSAGAGTRPLHPENTALSAANALEKRREAMAMSDADLDDKISRYSGHLSSQQMKWKDSGPGSARKARELLQVYTDEKKRRMLCPSTGSKAGTAPGPPRSTPQEDAGPVSCPSFINTRSSLQRQSGGREQQQPQQQCDRKMWEWEDEAGPSSTCQQAPLPGSSGSSSSLEGRTFSGQQAGPSGQHSSSRVQITWPQPSDCKRTPMVLRSAARETSRFSARQPSNGLGASVPAVDAVRKGKSAADSLGIGQSKDTAMELFSSDDEEPEKVVISPGNKTSGNGRSRRPGLRPSITCSLEGCTIAYPSRDDPDAIEVPSSDLTRLLPLEFLNDTIIDFYIKYIQSEGAGKDSDRFHFFNSFFYKKLSDIVHQKAKRGESKECKENKEKEILKMQKWTKGTDIFDKAYLFVPVHDNLHWSLAIICLPPSPGSSPEYDPCIYHLDSMQPGHNSTLIFKALKMYLSAEWSQRFDTERTRSELPLSKKLKMTSDIFQAKRVQVPQQENESDCGLFLLHYIERFILESPPHWRWGDSLHEKFFGRKWFDPGEASGLRDTIRALLESLFEAEAKAGPPVSKSCDEGSLPMTEKQRDVVTVDAETSMPEVKEKSCSEDDVQLIVDLAAPEMDPTGTRSASPALCSQDSVVQLSKECPDLNRPLECGIASPEKRL